MPEGAFLPAAAGVAAGGPGGAVPLGHGGGEGPQRSVSSELELNDVRSALAYSTQLSNIGRRLGLGDVDPRSCGRVT
eukprot:COSAG02_NODE_18261_length_950_cov_1.141011_2_plen_76_part_01